MEMVLVTIGILLSIFIASLLCIYIIAVLHGKTFREVYVRASKSQRGYTFKSDSLGVQEMLLSIVCGFLFGLFGVFLIRYFYAAREQGSKLKTAPRYGLVGVLIGFVVLILLADSFGS